MNKLLVLPILVLSLISFQLDAQCYPTSKSDKKVTISNNQQIVKTVKFQITGITCAGCSNTIHEVLKEVDGVTEHSVEYPGDIAVIQFNKTKTSIEALKAVIEKKGYKVENLIEFPGH